MRRRWLVTLLLTAVTVAVYAQTTRHDFVGYDDNYYVVNNPIVRSGVTLDGAHWAFTTGYGSTWQPLTWLSLMLDAQLSQVKPAWFHWTNLILHIINTLLLFEILRATTGKLWCSAFAAALFAVHPLHVESVAWVAARKDVLSTFFGLWAIATHVTYAERGGAARYAGVVALMVLSLMSKPMFVSLPLMLLLMDAWPLGRLRDLASARRLVVEKLPLLGISVGASFVTFLAESAGGAIAGVDELSIVQRCANGLVSYVRYLGKTLWPVDLSVLYPHPYIAGSGAQPWALWQIAGSALLLLAISGAVYLARRRGYVVFGWLWFLVTSLPVIGIVQFGEHAMADRFTYVPLIGLFVLLAWSGADLVRWWRVPEFAVTWVGTGVVAVLALVAWHQTAHWKDSETLFARAIAVTPNNSIMQYNYANSIKWRGDLDGAIRHYRLVIALNPDNADAHYNLGNTLASLGRLDEAIEHYQEAFRISGDPKFQGTLERALERRRRESESVGREEPRR
jgi:hypothetical protein